MENASALPKVSVYPLIGIGIVSGLFAAMFGIGGGVVIVPLLMLLTKMPPRIAAATSLATLLLTSLIGTARYSGSGHIDWTAAVLIGAPAVIGVLLGIRFQKRLPADWLIIAFGVLIIGIGVKLVFAL
ncbi:MAG: sulfite exporter TauE/SafE family protein [Gaiellales bacterium]